MALKDECTSKTLLLNAPLPQCNRFASGTVCKALPCSAAPTICHMRCALPPQPSEKQAPSFPCPCLKDIRVHISTAPTQVVAILEKSRKDISPCVERLLEVPHWLTAITGVSEVKGVMSNWGLFHFRDARSCLLVHPTERIICKP